MLGAITPQDVFNLILEDTYSVFAGGAESTPYGETPDGDPGTPSKEASDGEMGQDRELENLLKRS